MDWLQFIAAVIGHLAWPIVILIVIFSVRKHLGSLAERILELSFGGATVKFDKLLSKGAELIEQTRQVEKVQPSDDEQRQEITERLKKHLDQLAIPRAQRTDDMQALTLFRDIEVKLNEIGAALDMPLKDVRRPRAREILAKLRADKLVDRELPLLFETLMQGRNVLVHGGTIQLSQSELEEYVRQASYFLVSMEILLEKLRKNGGS